MDYRNFRLSKLNTDEFRHVKLLLFWPLFGIMFSFVERFYNVGSYYVMHLTMLYHSANGFLYHICFGSCT